MRQPNDLSRSLIALDIDSTLIAVIELSQSSWLVAGRVPGVERQPLKKLGVDRLLSRAGAQEGDIVWIGEFSFEYEPDL